MSTINKWCGVYIKGYFYSLSQKNAFGAVMNYSFEQKKLNIRKMLNKNCLFYYIFLISLCPHKDKLVLHCNNDTLMNFLSRNEILCIKKLKNWKYLFIKGIKCLSISQGI